MKRGIIIVDVGPKFRQHIENQVVKKDTTLSKYIRAILKKATNYKEKDLI